MKKKIASLLLASSLLLPLCGCDTRDGYNVECIHDDYYVNVTDQLRVNTYNGFKVGDYEIVENGDGTYTVTVTVTPTDPTRK